MSTSVVVVVIIIITITITIKYAFCLGYIFRVPRHVSYVSNCFRYLTSDTVPLTVSS